MDANWSSLTARQLLRAVADNAEPLVAQARNDGDTSAAELLAILAKQATSFRSPHVKMGTHAFRSTE